MEGSTMRSKRRRRYRSHKLLATLILLVALAGVGGLTDLSYVSLKSQADRLQADLTADLQAGQRELEAGKAALGQANAKRDASLVSQAIANFVAAKNDFLAAVQRADNSRFLRYIEYAPAFGDLARSRHTAVDEVGQMGSALADAGQDIAKLDAEIIKPPSGSEAGRTLLTVVGQVHAGLSNVRADLERAQGAGARVAVSVLPTGQRASFLKARDSIDSALAGFAEFERLVPVLTEALGGNGPRTYLVEQVNPAELRAGGGFIGTYSLLQADHGSLKVIRSGDAYDLANPRPLPGQRGFIPQPTPYREIIPNTSWSFVDSNIYPDFPANAMAAENFVQAWVGKLDGVISIDYYTVARMLQLTGPMVVPGYGVQVTADNFVALAMRHDLAGDVAHKVILSALAGPLLGQIASFSPDRWPTLIGLLNSLASDRHIQVFFNDGSTQTEIDRVGWSGTLNPGSYSDFMMEVESNYYGTKSNYWIARHYSIDLQRSGNTLHHRVTVDLVNNEPCGIEERWIYKADIRLYVGSSASSLSDNLRAVTYSNPAPPPGTRLLDGWLFVDCGGNHGQAVFEYNTPWPTHDKAGWKIYWQKQPGTVADGVNVSWTYDGRASYQAAGDLGQDRLINLMPTKSSLAPGHPAVAALPSLSL